MLHKLLLKGGATLALLAFSLLANAQMPPVEMADTLRQNGKIYVVVIGVAVIFLGLLIYLISMEKRLRKLEHPTKKTGK